MLSILSRYLRAFLWLETSSTKLQFRSLQLHKGTLLYLIQTMVLFTAICSNASSDSMTARQSLMLDSIMSNYYIDYCCNSTISKCIAQGKGCIIAKYLQKFAEWLVNIYSEPIKITEELDKRYSWFISIKTLPIDTAQMQWIGDPAAPVEIVAYVSSACNLCKYIVGSIYDSITTGNLKGKARLMAKPFGTGIGDIALLAANAQGNFWKLFLTMRNVKTRYTEESILQMADSLGMPSKRFQSMLHNPNYKEMLTACRKEGAQNGVEVTPTFFINGRRYSSFKDSQWVVDACLYEYHQKSGTHVIKKAK